MYYALKRLKKFSQIALILTLTAGAMALIGFLSFTELYAAYPLLAPAVISFILAAVIEGEVYRQNIIGAVEKIFSKQYLQRKIILDKYAELTLEKAPKHSEMKYQVQAAFADNEFAMLYCDTMNLLHTFHEKDHNAQLTEFEKDEQAKAQKRLKYLGHYICNFVTDTRSQQWRQQTKEDLFDAELAAIFPKTLRHDINKTISKKMRLKHITQALVVTVGIGSLFSSADVISSALSSTASSFGLAIAATTLPMVVWPFAIIAGAGYSLMIYNTVLDMIHDEKLKAKAKSLFAKYKYRENESQTRHVVRVIGVTCLITLIGGLGVFATVTTAGTWWLAIKKGTQLLPYLSTFGNWIRNITVPAVALTTLQFNLKNSLESLVEVMKTKPVAVYENAKQHIQASRAEQNALQFFNPFKILYKVIAFPYKVLAFIGHLASIGLTQDRLFNAKLSTGQRFAVGGISAGSEGFEDFHYLTGGDGHGHGHDHGPDIPGLFFKYIVAGWLTLLFVAPWDWAASHHKSAKETLTLKQAIKKNFGFDYKHPEPESSGEELSMLGDESIDVPHRWQKQEAIMRCNKEINRLIKYADEPNVQRKVDTFTEIKQQIYTTDDTQPKVSLKVDESIEVQRRHRFFSPRQPRSAQMLEKLGDSYQDVVEFRVGSGRG